MPLRVGDKHVFVFPALHMLHTKYGQDWLRILWEEAENTPKFMINTWQHMKVDSIMSSECSKWTKNYLQAITESWRQIELASCTHQRCCNSFTLVELWIQIKDLVNIYSDINNTKYWIMIMIMYSCTIHCGHD